MQKSFEKYLLTYECDMPDNFDKWVKDLDVDVLMMYADKYAQLRVDYAYHAGMLKGRNLKTNK